MSAFGAYLEIGDKRYREIFGLDFEEFEAGQVFHHRPGITVSQQDNVFEATETLNNAMLHYDGHYAAQSEWKQCLGVSTLTLQKVLGSSWKTFYKKQAVKRYADIAMVAPVFGGDTLYARSTIEAVAPGADATAGELQVLTEALKQDGQVVAKVRCILRIWRRGHFPEDRVLAAGARHAQGQKFAAYHPAEGGALMEQAGLFYEDLDVGETYEHRPARSFFEGENWLHATHYLDWHPRFVDLQYMAEHHHGRMPVSEHHVLSAVSALTTRTFGRVVANLGWTDIELHQPVHVGDTLRVESTILDKRLSNKRPHEGIMTASSQAFNQHGERVLSYRRVFLIYRRGQGPYAAAGY